jgi:hypothetical protein
MKSEDRYSGIDSRRRSPRRRSGPISVVAKELNKPSQLHDLEAVLEGSNEVFLRAQVQRCTRI